MIGKILLLLLFLYFLALLQTSFLVHFSIGGVVPNFILISVILIIFFASRQKWWRISSAFIGGFFLDIFSAGPIGWNILILVGLFFFIKIILRGYVRSPIHSKSKKWTNILKIKKYMDSSVR